jgi:pimeloyl-ACP methyl ester carboxylesterase
MGCLHPPGCTDLADLSSSGWAISSESRGCRRVLRAQQYRKPGSALLDGSDGETHRAGVHDAFQPSSNQSLLESSLSETYHLLAPDYPGFGHSSWPNPKEFAYTFDSLAKVMQDFVEGMHLDRYTLFMQDYGGPVGFRMAVAHPEKIQAMIIQNAVSHEEGLSALWAVRQAFWEDRAAHEAEVRANLLSLEATKKRHLGTSPDVSQYNPDLWVDEYYFLNQPGQADIQLDLFYDYQNNVKSYPKWQQWLRDHQPPLLVLWGRYDTSFTVAGGEAYRRDDPHAEVHILDAGHFALDLKAKEMIGLIEAFMKNAF